MSQRRHSAGMPQILPQHTRRKDGESDELGYTQRCAGLGYVTTGSTGSVGSAVANELLKAGLKVRAIVRNLEKGGYLSDVFGKRYSPDVFEIVHAENLADSGVLKEAMIGCAGVVHMATDTSLGTSPEQVITPTVDLARAILEAAAKTPTVRRVVFTSSAATLPRLHEPVHISPSSWASDDVVRMAWSSLPGPPNQDAPSSSSSTTEDSTTTTMKSLLIYAASKIEAERACWAFMNDEGSPRHFVLNTVVPMTCLGAFVHPRLVSSMNGMLLGTWRGDREASTIMRVIGAQCHVDLEDLGLLHLAALVLDDVRGERIVAMGGGVWF
ncbi:NAD-dependent epimerase/dehydratase terH [Apiospora rasikravindrae]|uniref:NAD-dependent epimerase/dehydratase terH n=1 Tax=Apiospora rasikravindrae TaxID=990691 RepID=A0ABR1S271_9PEZI